MHNLNIILQSLNLNVTKVSTVTGGDINKAYCLHTDDGRYFIKVNNADDYPALFEKEANGLIALKEATELTIPEVIAYGIEANLQYLLLQWMETGKPHSTTWEHFGSSLAKMHKQPQNSFGFGEDNYLGTYLQKNTFTDSWHEFYTAYRILPMIALIADQGKIDNSTVTAADNFCRQLSDIFPAEPPALIHGDLWSGNFIVQQSGKVALIDPAVYYGHREMDIGMSKLFGGFAPGFYSSYNTTYPLEKGWEGRLPYTQLYPLLFHALAFSGHYVH